eukprot:scaffold556705_cov24-Prasinocladus_malaysianus.AAC.1
MKYAGGGVTDETYHVKDEWHRLLLLVVCTVMGRFSSGNGTDARSVSLVVASKQTVCEHLFVTVR